MSQTDIAEKLEQTFEYSAIWLLEKLETGQALTANEDDSVDLYFTLARTLEDVSPALMRDTRELAAKHPSVFETSLVSGVVDVLGGFHPATAAEFITKLNVDIQKRTGHFRAEG